MWLGWWLGALPSANAFGECASPLLPAVAGGFAFGKRLWRMWLPPPPAAAAARGAAAAAVAVTVAGVFSPHSLREALLEWHSLHSLCE